MSLQHFRILDGPILMSDDSTPETNSGFPLAIDFGENGGQVTFTDREQATAWLEEQHQQWIWAGPYDGRLKSARDSTTHRINDALEAVRGSSGASFANLFRQRAEELFIAGRIPLAGTPLANEFLAWSQDDVVGACLGVTTFFDCELKLGDNTMPTLPANHLRAVVRGTLLREGIPTTCQGPELSLDEIRRKWAARYVARESEFRSLKEAYLGLHQEVQELKKELGESIQSSVSTTVSTITDFSDQFESIKTMYREELSTRAAVDYWNRRKQWHFWFALGWGVVALVLMVTGPAYIVSRASGDTNEAMSTATRELLESEKISRDYGLALLTHEWILSSAMTVAYSILFLWALRIFVRSYLSHTHLSADASERAIVVQTYLALLNDPALKDNENAKNELLPLMIQHIFRHASDGIVKDDAWPWQTLVDAMKNR